MQAWTSMLAFVYQLYYLAKIKLTTNCKYSVKTDIHICIRVDRSDPLVDFQRYNFAEFWNNEVMLNMISMKLSLWWGREGGGVILFWLPRELVVGQVNSALTSQSKIRRYVMYLLIFRFLSKCVLFLLLLHLFNLCSMLYNFIGCKYCFKYFNSTLSSREILLSTGFNQIFDPNFNIDGL